MKLVSFGLRLVLPLLACSVALGQGQLWVVDKAGGPGADFTEIQPAIDAAADGDTILVHGGSYGAITIDGKGLTLVADSGAFATTGAVVVRNLAAGSDVVVRALQLKEALLEANAGTVLLEAIDIGVPFLCGEFTSSGGKGLTVNACPDVVVVRGRFLPSGANPGIAAANSGLHLYDCDVQGGRPGGFVAAVGSDGVSLTDTFLFASGGRFIGGCGGFGAGLTSSGGDGGVALRRIGGAVPQLLGTELIGGHGECCADFPFCGSCGATGAKSVGGYALVAGFPRSYILASPAAGGGSTALNYDGQPGDLVFSVIALASAPLFVPELAGTIVPAIPPIVVVHGPSDGGGALALSVPLPVVPSGVALPIWAQGAALSAVGAAVLAAPTVLTIL